MRRHRVFISSTTDDLLTEREVVDEELTSLGFFEVTRVEKLPATDKPSERVCLDEVASSDALLLILAGRYGFIPPKDNPEGLSVTHIEYREARRLGLRVFAYIQRSNEREPDLESFVEEVSNYHGGLFHRTWSSTDELKHEVRRTAINWLSSDLRAGHMEAADDLVSAEIGRFPLDVSSSEIEPAGAARWLSDFLRLLETACRARFLPVPTSDAVPDTEFGIVVQTRASGPSLHVNLALHRRQPERAAPPPIELELEFAEGAVKPAVDAAVALVEAGTGDVPRALAEILKTASGLPAASKNNRESLLRNAAAISALGGGQLSDKVVREILALAHMQPATVDAGVLCLLAAQLRCERSGATRALLVTERLSFDLLVAALEQSEAKPSTLYNLGRQALKHSPQLGLSLFDKLLRVEPSYEERWYFHRDLGLVEYGARHYSKAAQHYDHACRLKDNDSELWRQAGDARYYDGQWAEALLRYERAVAVDPIEEYFLDMKLLHSRSEIATGRTQDRGFRRRFERSTRLAALGTGLAEAGRDGIAGLLFRITRRVCSLCFDANRWLALYCNRRGDYDQAITHLENALSAMPENPYVRLNLAANLVFRNDGVFSEDALRHVRIAVFHGGPEILSRFGMQMTNTAGRESLVAQVAEVFASVAEERDRWLERRRAVQAPEKHGGVIHLEFR